MTIVFKFRLRNHKSLDFHRPLRYFFPRSEISPVFRKVSRRRCFSVLFSFTAGWQVTNEFRHNTTTHSCSNLYRETSVRLRRTPHTSQTAIIANNFTFTGYGRLVRFSGKSSDGSPPVVGPARKVPSSFAEFRRKITTGFLAGIFGRKTDSHVVCQTAMDAVTFDDCVPTSGNREK